MSKGHITAYHQTKGTRRFSAGIWAAMGLDKQGFTEQAPMPEEIKIRSKFKTAEEHQAAALAEYNAELANAELREMHQKGEVNATTIEEVEAVFKTAIERAAKKGRKPKAI